MSGIKRRSPGGGGGGYPVMPSKPTGALNWVDLSVSSVGDVTAQDTGNVPSVWTYTTDPILLGTGPGILSKCAPWKCLRQPSGVSPNYVGPIPSGGALGWLFSQPITGVAAGQPWTYTFLGATYKNPQNEPTFQALIAHNILNDRTNNRNNALYNQTSAAEPRIEYSPGGYAEVDGGIGQQILYAERAHVWSIIYDGADLYYDQDGNRARLATGVGALDQATGPIGVGTRYTNISNNVFMGEVFAAGLINRAMTALELKTMFRQMNWGS